jgi:hypothetical protein
MSKINYWTGVYNLRALRKMIGESDFKKYGYTKQLEEYEALALTF